MSSRRRTHTAKATQLGDLSFDDWYETPVFEEEPDERLEQLATSKRAPLRLIGNTVLRLAPPPTPDDPVDESDGIELEPDFESYCIQRTAEPERSWRRRAARLLDRWADAEIASQARLEAMVLPRRWRS